jgi:lipopolysaccharide transport system ATP-binding protein
MEPIIKVENLGKSYIIGHQRERYVALRDVLTNKARQIASKTKNILSGGQLIAGNELEEFWALKEINFEVLQGDRVGIIGHNGAGKSTLLKVLSRITEPTTGRIQLKGRVASLLEVGTGFHPELSGRENIYLNGAILGMSRAEVKKKFDEIIDFAGVEKFLDTPVKRYSSGMYVRLAFAVAAHLEPEILIVDEVLAVGDAEFQKKCLGKMEDVSKNQGRTVLFVSHNMGAIQNLCTKCILLEKGELTQNGLTSIVISKYLNNSEKNKTFQRPVQINGNPTITSGHIENKDNTVAICITVFCSESKKISVDLRLKDSNGNNIGFGSLGTFSSKQLIELQPGENSINFQFSTTVLALGNYYISLDLTLPDSYYYDRLEDCLSFEVVRKPEIPVNRVLNHAWGYGSFEIPLTYIK